MRPSRLPSALAPILGSVALLSACSILNAPDDVSPGGDGGAGPSTTSQGGGPATGTAGGTTTSSTGDGGAPAACDGPADCDATECEEAACEDGRCVVTPRVAGTACGPEAATCQAAGVCDGDGACFVADLEGATCAGCDGDPAACVCRGGACGTCEDFAPVNLFADADLPGWELTGGWGLYTRFPRDRQSPNEVPIGKRVLGTDGNRSHPYPGGDDPAIGGSIEQSTATSPLTILPEVLTFRSWHEDEGGAGNGRDNKRILLVLGADVVPIVDCAGGLGSELPFCQLPSGGGLAAQRSADAWDDVAIDVPAELVGAEARIQLQYDSVDAAGGRERGWFIDALGAAGRCGCSGDGDCAYLTGPCSEGVCEEGACTFRPRAASEGAACGSGATSACSTSDRCDAFGLCDPGHRVDGTACNACDGGDCQACGAGQCIACESALQTFDGLLPTSGWSLDGSWGTFGAAPASDSNPVTGFSSTMFGTDGGLGGPEASTATTIDTVIPDVLTFSSWHVDQGALDNKTITVVTDALEIVLVDCAGGVGAEQPFCSQVTSRAGLARDEIAIPTGEAAGSIGRIVFGYDTADSTQTFEQGWYIDDLNAVRCP